jgi:ssDNA-binding Zn-finger/Zn-ribbon topoisomerase 1
MPFVRMHNCDECDKPTPDKDLKNVRVEFEIIAVCPECLARLEEERKKESGNSDPSCNPAL